MSQRSEYVSEAINAVINLMVIDWARNGRPENWDVSSDYLRTLDWLLAEVVIG